MDITIIGWALAIWASAGFLAWSLILIKWFDLFMLVVCLLLGPIALYLKFTMK